MLPKSIYYPCQCCGKETFILKEGVYACDNCGLTYPIGVIVDFEEVEYPHNIITYCKTCNLKTSHELIDDTYKCTNCQLIKTKEEIKNELIEEYAN